MPHKVLTKGDLEMVAAKNIVGVNLRKVSECWTAALNYLEETEGWRVVGATEGALTKEPIIFLYKEV